MTLTYDQNKIRMRHRVHGFIDKAWDITYPQCCYSYQDPFFAKVTLLYQSICDQAPFVFEFASGKSSADGRL